MKIASIDNVEEIERFLLTFEDSSLFLLANLFEYGTQMGDHPNSGDYYGIYGADSLKSVFSVTKRGNLLIQDGGEKIEASKIIDFLDGNSSIPLTGCLGSSASSKELFELLVARGLRESYSSNEILYSFDLGKGLPSSSFQSRKIGHEYFKSWMNLQVSFAKELGLESNLNENYYSQLFKEKAEGVGVSGLVIDNKLIGCAHLNAEFRSLCQVGGVYTQAKHRRKGYSHDCMGSLMQRCHKKGYKKMILFTGEHNFSAQRLYESIGFKKIGYYGLFIGAY